MKKITSTSCRSVGPGGTSVTFFSTKEGIKCVWENENCPYDFSEKEDGSGIANIRGTNCREALDGHNVSLLSWEEIENMLKSKPKDPSLIGMPQPKRRKK
jgi:hypothetical protein